MATDMRQRIYLTIVSVSLILLFFSIWQIEPVIVEPQAPLGLVSYLTPAYWVGLALILIASVLAVLDRGAKKDAIFFVILTVLALFVSGIAVFVQQNASEPDAYAQFPAVYDLLRTSHLNFGAPLETYNSWPAYHFLSSAMVAVAGVGFSMVRYVPLVWLLFMVLLTYGMGKRLGLAPNYCFMLSCLAILSSWSAINEYTPRLLGMIILLLLLLQLLTPRQTIGGTLTAVILFAALVITHGTSSMAAGLGILFISAYRRDFGFPLLIIVIFASWQLYQTPTMFVAGIHGLRTTVLNIFEISRAENYAVVSSASRLAARYSQLGYLVTYFCLILGSVFLTLRRRITGQRLNHIISLFAWAFGVGSMIFIASGAEVTRTYIFLTIPFACVAVLSFLNWKVLIPVACIFAVLFLMARYSTVASFGQVLTTELKGTNFFATKVAPQTPEDIYFSLSYSDPSLVMYYNRALLTFPYWTPNNLPSSKVATGFGVLDRSRYVIFSKQGNNELILRIGMNPYTSWLQTDVGKGANLIYNNRDFQIYGNKLIESEN